MEEINQDITIWILDFLARQPVSKLLLNNLLSNSHVPISYAISNPRFKKTLTLRSIQDEIANGVISQTILESLEIIEELDKIQNIKILDSMKKAYCAVAVDCTVKHLSNGIVTLQKPEFFEAVEQIWRERIEKLDMSKKSELVSDELREVKDLMEAAVWDSNACKRLVERDARNEALMLLKDYLREAMDLMGPSFLELVARADKEKCSSRIMDSKDADQNVASSRYDLIPSPEVNKVKEALKSSSMELKTLVVDPLPDALNQSEALVTGMGREPLNKDTSVQNKNGESADVPEPSVTVTTDGETLNHVPLVGRPSPPVMETIGSILNNYGRVLPSYQSSVPKRSIMERNRTARTYEWNDSIDGSPKERANYHLDSLRRKTVSPLKVHTYPKIVTRRRFKKWSMEEENALREGVTRFGVGNWKTILNCNPNVFEDRTMVDLKDKWRNMTKY